MLIKCKMCGGDIEFTPGATFGTCGYCGSTSTIPKADDESKVNRYNRANHYRRQCEFEKALAAYEKILEQDENDAEAHWGAVISRFGIEYVEDPATKKRVPTCHRVQLNSILADPDYLAAVENAPDAESRGIYKEEAQRIAAIQKEILSISENEKPYDVFICYKETDESNRRTRDSMLAQDVYYGLTEQGYKVFFSRITLEDKLGQQFEPYIFAALNSAKVMVAIGTKPEYFNAVWVKNEWSRYLALMAKDHKRLLIPCYRDMDPYDLPEELSNLQSQDMGKIGFMQDLLRGIKKVLSGAEKKDVNVKPVVQQIPTPAGGASAASLLERAYMFLEDGEWQSADEYCEKVLDMDPKNARAYFGKLMAKMKVRKETSVTALRSPIRNDGYYQKAVRFADAAQKNIYEGYAKAIDDGIEYDRQEKIYKNALNIKNQAKTEKDYLGAADLFESIPMHKDSSTQTKQCLELAQQTYNERLYDEAVKILNYDPAMQSTNALETAIKDLSQIIDWKDSKKKIEECRKKIEELNRKAEAERRAAEAAAKKKKKITIIVCVIIAVIIAGAVLFVTVIQPTMTKNAKYNQAKQLYSEGDYRGAYAIYSTLTGYKDVDNIVETDENIAAIAHAAYIAQFEVGNTVIMGNYGGEAIEWLVLAEDRDNRVLITVKGQVAVCFNKCKNDGNEWESSYVRTWLNDTFYNTAFSEEEKAAITVGPTNDNVWLLSVDEVNAYFANDNARVCHATQTAKDNGAHINNSDACWWWLRSPGSDSIRAVDVDSIGRVYNFGYFVRYADVCVRPVVVVRLP